MARTKEHDTVTDRPLVSRMLAGGVAVALVGCMWSVPSGYADDRKADDSNAAVVVDSEQVEGTSSDVQDDATQPTGEAGVDESGATKPVDDSANSSEDEGGGVVAEPVDEALPGDSESGSDGGEANGAVAKEDAAVSEGASALDEHADSDASEKAEVDEDTVRSFAGATMYETAAAEAKAAFPDGSDSAVIVGPGDAWIDALSATGLAASKGPILFTEHDALHSATKKALKELGVKSVVIIGGTAAVSARAEQAIKSAGVSIEARLGGSDCYDTQMKIYEYGRSKGLWDASTAIIATGSHYGDALSVSPVAYAKKIPIFLVGSGDGMRNAQKQALVQGARSGGFKSLVLVGGTAAVSKQVEGFVSGVAYWNGGSYKRLAGATQYETSAKVAAWATSSQGLSWDKLAFSTGKAPYDALAGSVLQGGSKSVLLLIDGSNTATLSAVAQHKASIDHVRFLGGTAAVSQKMRNTIVSTLGIQKASRPKAAAALEGPVDDTTATSGELDAASDVQDEEAAVDSAQDGVASGGKVASNASAAVEGEGEEAPAKDAQADGASVKSADSSDVSQSASGAEGERA